MSTKKHGTAILSVRVTAYCVCIVLLTSKDHVSRTRFTGLVAVWNQQQRFWLDCTYPTDCRKGCNRKTALPCIKIYNVYKTKMSSRSSYILNTLSDKTMMLHDISFRLRRRSHNFSWRAPSAYFSRANLSDTVHSLHCYNYTYSYYNCPLLRRRTLTLDYSK